MILSVRVIPKANRLTVKKENNTLKVYLTKPAQDGQANAQLIDFLAKYLKVKRYQIRIIQGQNTRNKLLEIDAE